MQEIISNGDTSYIEFNGTKILFDTEDVPRIRNFHWYLTYHRKHGYPIYAKAQVGLASSGYRGEIFMHRLILSFPNSNVDHANRVYFDNRKSNLREATDSQNMSNIKKFNSIGYRGVGRVHRKFRASVLHQGKLYRSKNFSTPIEAALEYDRMAKELHGEFSILNFP